MRHSLLFVVLFLFCFVSKAQFPIPIIKYNKEPISFINANGTVAFTLPAGHTLLNISSNSIQPISVFFDGKTIIQGPESIYAIGTTGKKLWTVSTQNHFANSPKEGFILLKDKRRKGNNFYINTQGTRVFSKQIFWRATSFSEGYASVQINEGDDWIYINKKGEKAISIPEITGFEPIWIGSFDHGVALIQYKNNTDNTSKQYHLIDTSGKVLLDLSSICAGLNYRYFYALGKDRFVIEYLPPNKGIPTAILIDNEGRIIKEMPNFISATEFKNGKSWIRTLKKNQGTKAYFYSYTIDKMDKLRFSSSFLKESANVEYQNSDFSIVERTDDINEVYDCVYDQHNNTVLFKSYGNIKAYEDGIAISAIVDGFKNRFELVDTRKKLVIWETPIEEWIFTSIEKGVPYKKEATNFRLVFAENSALPMVIRTFTNLKTLEVKASKNITEIPTEINQLKQLTHLSFESLDNVKTLPTSIQTLPNLTHLTIFDCSFDSKKIETILINTPSLRYVEIDGTRLSEAFLKQIKNIRPNLELVYSPERLDLDME